MDLITRLNNGRLYLDGGFGTMLQKKGLNPGEHPELWNIAKPDAVIDIHREYIKAGCDIISTNTFGANCLNFNEKELDDIIHCAVDNAKAARNLSDKEYKYIALDIGPTGRMLKPLGDLDFEAAVEVFSNTIRIGVRHGVDLILIETMNDCYETKAAVIAAKESCSLPIFVTNTYDQTGKLMTGACPSAMVAMLEGLGVDAIGINCGFGPDKMMQVVEELMKYSSLPVIVSPNAGMPVIRNGKTEYDLTSEGFSDIMTEVAKKGAVVLGGCCGTTPEYIRMLKEKTKDIPGFCKPKQDTLVSSYTHSVKFGEKPVLIGERINPTGKKPLKEALKAQNFEYILNEAISQQEARAEVLDVNVGLPEIDEAEMLKRAVFEIQSICDLPLQIDTADIQAMEGALRIYNGKPLINSVNGKEESMSKVFPLVKKYGGVIVALTIDDDGIPKTTEGRVKIAEKIISRASEYGIEKKDIIVDPLAMTVSSEPDSAIVTLECIGALREKGIKTTLGVSNVSFGLPKRDIINSAFFTMAMQNGLDAAIMNPHSREMMEAYYGYCAVTDKDEHFERFIEYASKHNNDEAPAATDTKSAGSMLKNSIIKGLRDNAEIFVRDLLKTKKPLEIIDEYIIPSLNEMGKSFEEGTAFLPQLLMSAEAAKTAFEMIKSELMSSGSSRNKKMKIILATVKGDIHDIGKNIVKTLLENYDFDVIDLGKDVLPELIVEKAKENNVRLVGLSALMTTTVPSMAETIRLIRKTLPECRVVVGGAVLTEEYAKMINADKYSKDAMETVRYAESMM